MLGSLVYPHSNCEECGNLEDAFAEKLVEYQALLSVEDIEAGIRYRQQFVDAVTALGGRYEDESTSFEHLIAKWPF